MKNSDVSIIPASQEAIEAMTGERLHITVRAYMVRFNEEDIGIIGLHPYGTHLVLFSYIRDDVQKELKRYRRPVIQAYRYMMDIMKAQPLPVYSRAQEDVEGADRLLLHLGFKPYKKGVFEWRGSD